MAKKHRILLFLAAGCTLISLYQLLWLSMAQFYTLFSIGLSMLFAVLYEMLTEKGLFPNWKLLHHVLFWVDLIIISVCIDKIGVHAGYWDYPHYDQMDQVRKYIFEWGVALFYHLLALLLGIELFRRLKAGRILSFALSLFLVITLVGFITESLNLKVHSWRVRKMPISDIKIGNYFVVFQTLGYWLMALIPYGLYEAVSWLAAHRVRYHKESGRISPPQED